MTKAVLNIGSETDLLRAKRDEDCLTEVVRLEKSSEEAWMNELSDACE